jgi:DNA-directed RNA polymerase II subunit RPB2
VIYSILSSLQGKGMEVARHVFNTYFSDVTNVLVRHHLDSYADLLNNKIPTFLKGKNPLPWDFGDGRMARIYFGGKASKEIKYLPPVDEITGNAILPHMCRLENKTYKLAVQIDLDIEYEIEKSVHTVSFKDVILGEIPLMVKSSLCYLSNMTSDELYAAGECKFEVGGYFIIEGQERVLLTQERLGDNMFYASERIPMPDEEERTKYEKEQEAELKSKYGKSEKYEYIAGIKSISEDGTKGPFWHFLVIPPKPGRPIDPSVIAKTNKDNPMVNYGDFYNSRLSLITLPGFVQQVPVFSVFHALGLTNDQDIYDTILCGIPPNERRQYDELFMELVFSHENYLKKMMEKANDKEKNEDPNMLTLFKYVRNRTKAGVYINLYRDMFPHCEQREEESTGSFYRRKAYLLGHMMRMAMEVALGIKPKTDREHYRFKRLDASGELCFQEFRRIYKDFQKEFTLKMDSKVHFQQALFEGEKLKDLIQSENLSTFLRNYMFLSEFEKSFKGKWGGSDGVSQVMNRLSYLGTVAHLRRVNVATDKDTKQIEIRRIHGSSWGLLCPIDNPDGRSVGMIKSLTLLSTISNYYNAKNVGKLIESYKHFVDLTLIHPSTWNTTWTKIFLNSDLIGVCQKDTEVLHSILLDARRSGEIDRFVSLCWNRLENEYIIYTDAGRPSRPVYREGITEDRVRKTKRWQDMTSKLMDYIDGQECESIRISMNAFSPKLLSEIHPIAILSASGSVIPYADHNAVVRNMFSCNQTKQACAWFNTAFNKRFDTIATWLNYAQRPLCQTWTMNSVLGNNGCLAYGKTLMIAIATYTGYNQEDSMIFNDSSLKRGLFTITYYHSYDFKEEVIGEDSNMKIEFANVLTDPKYRETVVRNSKLDYSMLGPDGIIRKGVPIHDKMVLVGKVSPIVEGNQIKGYIDKPERTKKGQHGFIDDVYVYINDKNERCVKIRIAETREPQVGDKFSVRHGPKGTCGARLPEEDMPYTSTGLRPDMILNPHAFPSRMALGQVIEMMTTKAGVHLGCLTDATPFTTQNRLGEAKDMLLKSGFHPYGHEILYNGMNGEMIQSEIFMGPTFYLRLKQMVEDKINYRDEGPMKLLTHQPVEGRANDGGLKIGEMERDCLLSHGVAKFWNESMMERSDKEETMIQPALGKYDANPNFPFIRTESPYAARLMLNEIESMHISTHLTFA